MWGFFLVNWNLLFKLLWWNSNIMIFRYFTFDFPVRTKTFELFWFIYWGIIVHVFLQRNIKLFLMNFIIFLFEITFFILMSIIDDTWLGRKMLNFWVTFHRWLLKFFSRLWKILSFSYRSVTYNLLRSTLLLVRNSTILRRLLNFMITII